MSTPARTIRGTAQGVAPMFLVDNVARTAEWYRDHLGFEIGEYFREDHGPHDGNDIDHPSIGEPVFVILDRDGHRLFLGRTEKPGLGVGTSHDAKRYSSDAYFWVDGIEGMFADVKATGVNFEFELVMMPYGLAEFQVVDCDGRHITFGGEPAPGSEIPMEHLE